MTALGKRPRDPDFHGTAGAFPYGEGGFLRPERAWRFREGRCGASRTPLDKITEPDAFVFGYVRFSDEFK